MALTKVSGEIIQNPLNVGIVTATSFSGSASGLTNIPAGQLTGALPALDGSALTGVVGSGSGVIVKDSGTVVGTAGTIDFGDNLTVSPISAGVVTVTGAAGGGGSIAGINTLGTSTFTNLNVTGVSTFAGITTVTGTTLFVKQLNASGVVTASSFSGSASGLTGIPAGQLTGALPALDGSALTGIVASGTGIVIKEEGTTIGTASTINFVGTGVTATFSSGIATVSITATGGSGSIAGIDTIGTSTFNNLSVSGVTTVAAGSVSAPSITPTGDSNTGIFFPSADTIAFGEGGAEALRIDSSGRVGIGTTNPTSKVHVVGDGKFTGIVTATTFISENSSGTPKIESPNNLNLNAVTVAISTDVTIGGQVTSNIIVGAGKSVGIGTTNPTSRLHVIGNSIITGVSTFGSSNGIGTVTIGIGTTALLVQGNARITGILTIGQGTITIDGDTNFLGLGTATSTGDQNSLSLFSTESDPPGATSFRISGPLHRIVFQGLEVGLLNGTFTSGQYGISASNELAIFTNSSEKVRVTSGGNVGIGTTNPTSKLTVVGSGTSTSQLFVTGVSTVGVVTGATYFGDGSRVVDGRWTVAAPGSSAYTFSGVGFLATTSNPVLYLTRGRVYEFVITSGGSHPFQIRTSSGGSAYNDGVTNNGATSGTLVFEVPFNAPSTLYYQCTNHSSMGNTINILDGTNLSQLNVTGVTTVAAGSTAAPSITPTGDSNTGIFFPSADTIAFGEGGVEAVRITSSGGIGIGTTSTNSRLLSITGQGNAGTQVEIRGSVDAAGIAMFSARQFEIQSTASNEANYPSSFIVYDRNANGYRMAIDGSGRLQIPSQPGFFASSNTNHANQPGSNSLDMLGTLFDTTSQTGGFNTGNYYNTGTGIFTAPVAGKYYTFFNMRWETANFVQNSYIRIFISKNNNTTLHIHQINGANEAWNSYMAMSCSGIIDLAAGDTLRPKGGLNGGTAAGYWNESSWGAWLLG